MTMMMNWGSYQIEHMSQINYHHPHSSSMYFAHADQNSLFHILGEGIVFNLYSWVIPPVSNLAPYFTIILSIKKISSNNLSNYQHFLDNPSILFCSLSQLNFFMLFWVETPDTAILTVKYLSCMLYVTLTNKNALK